MTSIEILQQICMIVGITVIAMIIVKLIWYTLDEITDRKKLKQQILEAQNNLNQFEKERFENICEQTRLQGELIKNLYKQIQLIVESDKNQDKMIIELKTQQNAITNNRDSNNND
jgi:hypothetical protein